MEVVLEAVLVEVGEPLAAAEATELEGAVDDGDRAATLETFEEPATGATFSFVSTVPLPVSEAPTTGIAELVVGRRAPELKSLSVEAVVVTLAEVADEVSI